MAQQQETVIDSRLNNILSTFSSGDQITIPKYNGNQYPEVDFPTGSNLNAVNNVPTRIAI